MPNTRELVELLTEAEEYAMDFCIDQHCEDCTARKYGVDCRKYLQADHLIANGVRLEEKQATSDVTSKWISVNDRLPEPGVDVLCWYEYFRFGNYNRMFQTYGIGYYFRDGMWGGEVSNGQKTKVLAWMPLPEPPKEDRP